MDGAAAVNTSVNMVAAVYLDQLLNSKGRPVSFKERIQCSRCDMPLLLGGGTPKLQNQCIQVLGRTRTGEEAVEAAENCARAMIRFEIIQAQIVSTSCC